jgi:ABC-type nickel/cobalt efflux system permease component RcnA
MYKKSIIVCALLIAVSNIRAMGVPAEQGYQPNQGYPAEQGYQTGHHHGHHHHHSGYSPADEAALATYQKDIEQLQKEIEDPYWKSNICWKIAVGGAAIGVIGFATDSKTIGRLGGATVVVFGPLGIYTRLSEAVKKEENVKEINTLRDRQEQIRKDYRHKH